MSGTCRSTSLRRSLLQGAINRPRCAEDLERRKPETTRFIFHQDLSEAQHAREFGRVDQRRGLIPWKAAMKGERRTRRRKRFCRLPTRLVEEKFGHHLLG